MKNSIDKLSKLKIKKQHCKHALWGNEDKYKKKHLKAKSGALREREMGESTIIKEPYECRHSETHFCFVFFCA